MYDIEFQIGVCFDMPWMRRIYDFKKYGLVNIGSKKVLVVLLPGQEITPSDLSQNWPENVDVKVIENKIKHSHLCSKLYNYYPIINDAIVDESRWFCKIDDDSITDVSGLVDSLDLEYDYQRDYVVVTCYGPPTEEHIYDNKEAIACGYKRWFEHGEELLPEHEIEGIVLSQSAMRKISKNETAKKFMLNRATIPHGYGDVALAYAARMCKIYPHRAYFMSDLPLLKNFSTLGGYLNHIHLMSDDTNRILFNFWKLTVDGTYFSLHQSIIKNNYSITWKKNKIPIRFKENGTIESRTPFKFWYVNGDYLILIKGDGTRELSFFMDKNRFINRNYIILLENIKI